MKSTRKNTKNVPRITAKVLAMTQIQREQWFTKGTLRCTSEQKAEVRTRLDEVNAGTYILQSHHAKTPAATKTTKEKYVGPNGFRGQGRMVDFSLAFKRCNVKELKDAMALCKQEFKTRVVEMTEKLAALKQEVEQMEKVEA